MPVSTLSPLSVDTQWRVRVSPIRVFVFAGRGVHPSEAALAEEARGARVGAREEAAAADRTFHVFFSVER